MKRSLLAVFMVIFALCVPPQAMAVHAVPKVFSNVTVELGTYHFGIKETERVHHHTFGSSIVPGTQVEVYLFRYLTAVPCSLGVFVCLLLALAGSMVWSARMVSRKFTRKV